MLRLLFCVVVLVGAYGASIQSVNDQQRSSIRRHQLLANRPVKDLDALNNVNEDVPCDVCEASVTELHELLTNPHTVDDIKAALKSSVCDRLQGDFKEMCDGLVDNIEVAIHFINPMLIDEKGFCQRLGLCGRGYNQQLFKTMSSLVKAYQRKGKTLRTNQPNDLACDECKFAVSELHSIVGEKEFQENSDAVCKELGLCQGGSQLISSMNLMDSFRSAKADAEPLVGAELRQFFTILNQLHTSKGAGVSCIACQFGLNTIKSIAEDSTEELDNVVELVEAAVCGLMPNPINLQCVDFLNYYGRTALIMTIRQLNSEKFCSMIGTCDATDLQLLAEYSSKSSILECEACEGTIDYLRYELDKPAFQKDVVNFLMNLCKKLPINQQTCASSLSVYVPYGIQAYAAIFSSDGRYFCQQLGACDSHDSAENEI